jgi:hypothetical protein
MITRQPHVEVRIRTRFAARICAGVVAMFLIAQCSDDNQRTTPETTPETARETAPSATESASTVPPVVATTTPMLSDQEIADASMLADGEIGERWVLAPDDAAWHLDAGAAAAIPSCAPFIDVVFESERRPAAVASAMFVKGVVGAHTIAYVVVLPDEAGARAMMDAVAGADFEACLLDYQSRPTPGSGGQHISAHLDWPPLDLAGDQSVLIGTNETFTGDSGLPWTYPAAWAFVRSGRIVSILGPPYVSYTDAELVAAVSLAVERMRAAAAGS